MSGVNPAIVFITSEQLASMQYPAPDFKDEIELKYAAPENWVEPAIFNICPKVPL